MLCLLSVSYIVPRPVPALPLIMTVYDQLSLLSILYPFPLPASTISFYAICTRCQRWVLDGCYFPLYLGCSSFKWTWESSGPFTDRLLISSWGTGRTSASVRHHRMLINPFVDFVDQQFADIHLWAPTTVLWLGRRWAVAQVQRYCTLHAQQCKGQPLVDF